MKRIGIILGIVVILVTAFSVYLSFFVTTPADITKKLFNSLDNNDCNTAFSCLNPKYEKAYKALSNITGGLLGISLSDAADLLPVFEESGLYQDPYYDFDVEIVSTEIQGSKINDFTEQVGQKVEGIGNLLGSEALVTINYSDPYTGARGTEVVTLENFDDYGWRVVSSSSLVLENVA